MPEIAVEIITILEMRQLDLNPLLHIGHYSVRIAKISILK